MKNKTIKFLPDILLLLLFFHLFLMTVVEFTAWPEMMLWPYLMLKGWLPYRDIAIVHNPLLLFDLSIWYKLFGFTVFTLKTYTWVYVLLTDILLYFISFKVFGRKTSYLALASYIPLQVYFQGNGVWFDMMLAPLALVLFYYVNNKKYFLSGVIFFLAYLTKQTAFWFLVPIGLAFKNIPLNKAVKWVGGVLLTAFVFLSVILALRIGDEYFYWAVKYAIGVLPKSVGQIKYPGIFDLAKTLIPFSSLLVLFFINRKFFFELFPWIFAGILGIFPRFELFHFQPSLPFLALTWGIVLSRLVKLNNTKKALTFFLLCLSVVFISRGIIRNLSKGDRFLESDIISVSEYIKDHSDTNDVIYVYNAWDNIYALSDRLPATKWFPFLSWYLNYDNQEEKVVTGLTSNPPKYIVAGDYTNVNDQIYTPGLIREYIDDNYQIVENIGIYSVLTKK